MMVFDDEFSPTAKRVYDNTLTVYVYDNNATIVLIYQHRGGYRECVDLYSSLSVLNFVLYIKENKLEFVRFINHTSLHNKWGLGDMFNAIIKLAECDGVVDNG